MPVAPFDRAGVDIVASLHLADGTVVPCFVLVVSLGSALKKVIHSSTSLIISSFSSLFIFTFIRVSCLNWSSIMCWAFLSYYIL